MVEFLIEVENMQELSGKAFRLATKSIGDDGKIRPIEQFRTGYAYYMGVIKAGKGKHLLGKFEDGKFYTRLRFAKDDYVESNWNEFSYVEKETGNKRNYFDKKYIIEAEMLTPTSFMSYNSDTRQNQLSEPVTNVRVVLSNGVFKKLVEQIEDPRSSINDYFTINFDKKQSPALMYSVKFARQGTPRGPRVPVTPATVTTTTTPVTVTTGAQRNASGFTLKPHERDLLVDINGEPTTPTSLTEYIVTMANKKGMESIDANRAATIALSVLDKNGVVRV